MKWWSIRRRDADLDRELRSDLELEEEEQQEDGLPPEEARYAARRAFGNMALIKEQTHEAWGWTWIDRLFQDLRYGLRLFRKSPSFTITATLILALGIGVNLTAFRILLLEITPTVRDPDTLVELARWFPDGSGNTIAWPVLSFYAQHARSFRAVIASHDDSVAFGQTEPGRAAETVTLSFVTPQYFVEQAPSMVSGRALAAFDESPNAGPAVVVSRRFWEHRLGATPGLIGQTLQFNEKAVYVVGIMNDPKGSHEDFWMPLAKQPLIIEGSTLLTDWTSPLVHGVARLNPGVTLRAAEEESRLLAAELRQAHPEAVSKDERLSFAPFSSNRMHPQEMAAAAIAVTLIMLILAVACANLGSLLLARGVAREREIHMRLALGASRARIVRQLLTESTLLAVAGSLVAWLLSAIVLQAFLIRNDEPKDWAPVFDVRIMAATLAVALLAALAFGLAPALRLTGSAPHAGRARSVFLAFQVGASCILLIVSGQLVRSFAELLVLDPGFDYRTTLTLSPDLHTHGYNDASAQQYFDSLRQRLAGVPGVQSVAVTWLPVWGNISSGFIEGGRKIAINRVDSSFFSTLNLRLMRGRRFNSDERDVAIVSESFARLHWHGEDPLGKALTITNVSSATVTGVVAKAGSFDIQDADAMAVYYPILPQDYRDASIVIRAVGDPGHLAATFIALASTADPKLRPGCAPLSTAYDDALSKSRSLVSILSALGLLASLLAAIGLAGLTGYSISQRTLEIGIRIALGAGGASVLRAVLRPLFAPVATGILLGMIAAAAVSTVLRYNLSGLRPSDPLAYLMAIVTFVFVVSAAVSIPARRALCIQPAQALRHD
jgi:predicted permease